MTAKLNLKIVQGSTFKQTLKWESPEKVYKPISQITKSAPVVLTVLGHEIPNNWRFKVTDVVGMKEINSSTVYHTAKVQTPDLIEINSLNSLGFTAYTSGGVIEYNKPIDLTGMTARMQIRPKIDSDIVLHSLTTENSGILLDNINKTINLTIGADITTEFDFTSGVYSLEVIDSLNSVIQLISGNISVSKEVTR